MTLEPENSPTTNGNMDDRPNGGTTTLATTTASEYQHVREKPSNPQITLRRQLNLQHKKLRTTWFLVVLTRVWSIEACAESRGL